jgi:hypothetical protein
MTRRYGFIGIVAILMIITVFTTYWNLWSFLWTGPLNVVTAFNQQFDSSQVWHVFVVGFCFFLNMLFGFFMNIVA